VSAMNSAMKNPMMYGIFRSSVLLWVPHPKRVLCV